MGKVYITLISKELQVLYRSRVLILAAIIIWTALLAACLFSWLQYRQAQHTREQANVLFQRQWGQQVRNPHDAAHFGTYLFKPLDLPAAFDPGLNDYAGTTFRIEAHMQHEVDFSQAQGSDASSRFGLFSPAMVLQLIVPLLIMATVSSSVTSEKEAGTYRMLLMQGRYPPAILWSKVMAGYIVFAGILLPFFVMMLLSVISAGSDWWLRSILITAVYLLYYLLLTAIATGISALSKDSRAAMLTALIFWLCTTILLPKIAAAQAEKKYPVMSRSVFEDKTRQGFLKGLDGHDPYYERADRYLKQLLQQYHTDSAGQLPVNSSALIMQQGEDYQEKVFNHYYKEVEEGFSQQQSFLDKAGLLDPFISLKRFSMSMAATDYYHHNEFYRQARTYRNKFIRTLNLELARHPDHGDGDYKAGPAFFQHIPSFRYHLPDIRTVILRQCTSLLTLGCWTLLAFVGLYFISKRLLIL
ncbi:MAG TPA: DUF3526 domain-containing protein [Chitinophaga sp.]|uniref:DUF3526 domain-containing protein n=1 Tax=Chitinophaga sp. TaxID=1869181 RepID=UPI002D0DD0FE|nr:DUF3526 domain-containing protein [Chitinophaga sp.]HVI48740.1 DUF3526 domain-containing protein [Chitinophaga sp.]